MSSQHNFQRISDTYLKPLLQLFGKSLNDEQIAAFVEDLADFSEDELRLAVIFTRRNSKYFPSINAAIGFCDQARAHIKHKSQPQPHQQSTSEQPWEAKPKQAKAMAAEYMQNARQKHYSAFSEAEAGGWGDHLHAFISESALVQAQTIVGCHAIGYSTANVFKNGFARREDVQAWLHSQHEQARLGYVDVAIPTWLFDQNKSQRAA